ncbi:MAG: hypothetical protein ABJA78_19555 [Ferruginibacter sp.]
MKKIVLFTGMMVALTSMSFSQIQRKAAKLSTDSASMQAPDNQQAGRKEMMRELNLSRQQKVKLKEAMQDMKAKKQAVDADTTLNASARQQKMRELKKMQLEKMNSILNEEQKEKLKQMRLNKKTGKKENEEDATIPQ